MFILKIFIAFAYLTSVATSSLTTTTRDFWLLNLSHNVVLPNSAYPSFTNVEQSIFDTKAAAWLRHALRAGDAGHIQFGQVMPQVLYSDPNMTTPIKYDDVGDSGAWAIRLHYKPFIRWIWLGAIFMGFGGLLTVVDKRYRSRRTATENKRAEVPGGVKA